LIDAHHHFWRYTREEYGWIPDNMALLRRDYLPEHLAAETSAVGIEGVVTVQVRQTVEESRWLLELAARHPIVKGVVGWAPLVDPGIEATLADLAVAPAFKGVRHILQEEPDNDLMDSSDFRRGVAALRRLGLSYDILIYERHLPQAIRFVDQFPDQTLILDHLAKPRIRDGVMEPWKALLREIARRPNLYCKLSGIATEADWSGWQPGDLEPYIDHALECFGPRRLMFGSDWPVALVATGYRRWFDTVVDLLSASERERVMGGTAVEAYRL
jgi:L-fuconolactonase